MDYYVSIFRNSKSVNVARYGEDGAKVSGRPQGTVMTVVFQIDGQQFIALNGGPVFTVSPAISFVVNCDTQDEVDRLWDRLSAGTKVKDTENPFELVRIVRSFDPYIACAVHLITPKGSELRALKYCRGLSHPYRVRPLRH